MLLKYCENLFSCVAQIVQDLLENGAQTVHRITRQMRPDLVAQVPPVYDAQVVFKLMHLLQLLQVLLCLCLPFLRSASSSPPSSSNSNSNSKSLYF